MNEENSLLTGAVRPALLPMHWRTSQALRTSSLNRGGLPLLLGEAASRRDEGEVQPITSY